VSNTEIFLAFGSGLITGMVILGIFRKLGTGEKSNSIGRIRRLCSVLVGAFRRSPDVAEENVAVNSVMPQEVEPREQELYESAQAIRNIVLVLAANIQRTDKAASDSSMMLVDVKSVMNTMALPTDLNDAQRQLLKEIDRVISSNSVLKGELAKSQVILAEQQRQIDDLRTAVRIDGLTKLANRTYFDEKLNEMVSLRKRYGDPFSLLMIDLDNFKNINDSYGHPAGDRILKGVALKIKASLRGSDFLARFGGDEYALILIKSDVNVATEVAWKLCEEVRASRFILDDTVLFVTLSIGVAEASALDSDETLLKRADQALYRAKAAGRNGVSIADVP
jgi:diguanylate cyclase